MNTIMSPLISIILPVYNRIEFLGQAIESALSQSYQNWELIIADDASDLDTKSFLSKYEKHERVHVHVNAQNIGLFANLNQAIENSHGDYLIFLCSDDCLLPECLETALKTLNEYPNSGFLLSAFHCITETGEEKENTSISHYERYMDVRTKLFQPRESVPLLLKYGSINGNLTGIFFSRDLYNRIGGLNEKSVQVGDWEWVYRVASKTPVVLAKKNIAMVRAHSQQLSGFNFKNLRNSLEVIEMIQVLLNDPILHEEPAASEWARHLAHFHLWYACKFLLKGDIRKAFVLTRAIHNTTGILKTSMALVKWLPERWHTYRKKSFVEFPVK
jgi:glycosyltransferase involved in cell wall biosynthesis